MKISAAILSLFLLMLSILPCSDEAPVENMELEQVASNDCDNSEAGDLCSPFCHCQCCSTHLIDFQLISFNALDSEIPVVVFAYFDNKEQEVFSSFLQPPRI